MEPTQQSGVIHCHNCECLLKRSWGDEHEAVEHDGTFYCMDCYNGVMAGNELASLRAEVEKLKAENAALRAGWEPTFQDGWLSAAYCFTDGPAARYTPPSGPHYVKVWKESASKQRLDEIAKGEEWR